MKFSIGGKCFEFLCTTTIKPGLIEHNVETGAGISNRLSLIDADALGKICSYVEESMDKDPNSLWFYYFKIKLNSKHNTNKPQIGYLHPAIKAVMKSIIIDRETVTA